MNTALNIIGKEQYIVDSDGQPEFVVLPVQTYAHLIELLEDAGLALAMKEAEGEPAYDKHAALQLLEEDEGGHV